MAVLLALVLVLTSFAASEATDFVVGGKENAWQIPSSPSEFDQWAQANRFKVGDYLVWKYDPKNDSVLEVTKEAFESCDITSPLKKYNDGDTKVELDRSGPFYFISGADGHCGKGQKLEVVVLSEGHHQKADAPSPTHSPVLPHRSGASNAPLRIVDVVGISLGLVAVPMFV